MNRTLRNKYTIQPFKYFVYPPYLIFSYDLEVEAQEVYKNLPDNKHLSLYIHFPFCIKKCAYCMYTSFPGATQEEVEKYLRYLKREIDLVCSLFNCREKEVVSLYWGGGSPTYLNNRQIRDTYEYIANRFNFSEDIEISIEIDCRTVDEEKMRVLKQCGANRLSFGIQTFDENILRIVNRYEETKRRISLIEYAKKIGFSNINIDILYGLPLQTLDILNHTLDIVIDLETPHLTYYSAFILSEVFPNQSTIKDLEYPDDDMKVRMVELIREKLSHKGYFPIAYEYFTKDEAYRVRFASMSRFERWLLGLGVAARGTINNISYGNVNKLDYYYQQIDSGNLPYRYTHRNNSDDLIRNYVINCFYLNYKISKSEVNEKFNIDFDGYFEKEKNKLDELEDDGLITQTSDSICLTEGGRLFTVSACDIFSI